MTRHRLHVLIPEARTTLLSPTGERHSSGIASVEDTRRVAAHIDWLISRSGGRRSAVAVVVPANPPKTSAQWAAVASHLSCPTVVVSRPLAAVAGLGLAPGAARMVVDRRGDGIEVSAVTEDGVIAAEHSARSTVADVVNATRSMFAKVDPDLEWLIRHEGVDLLTEGFDRHWVESLAATLGVTVRVTDDPVALLHAGVKADRAAIDRCLATEASPPTRRPHLRASDSARSGLGLIAPPSAPTISERLRRV